MKLLFITNLYPPHSIGGYEEVCHDIAEGLKQRGHTVVILTSCFRASALEAGNDVYRHLKTASGGPAGFASGAWTARTTLGLEWHNTLTVRRMLAGVDAGTVMDVCARLIDSHHVLPGGHMVGSQPRERPAQLKTLAANAGEPGRAEQGRVSSGSLQSAGLLQRGACKGLPAAWHRG